MTPLCRPAITLQAERGQLVCPRTGALLRLVGESLQTAEGEQIYPVVAGVPLLFADQARVAGYLGRHGGSMATEYAAPGRPWLRERLDALFHHVGDMRSPAAEEAFQAIFGGLTDGALCLSIGGGPARVHPALVNVNLGPFPNVDVAADAYELPYADGVVDAVHCEAVLEHLEFPDAAVREMHRVLRPGGQVFAATPFLQVFHGYPDHYQNFTLSGHVRLFERAGFTTLSAGTCVGPTFALRDLAANYLRTLVPGRAGQLAGALWSLFTLPFLHLDRLANARPPASGVASTTYIHAAK